MRRVGGLLVAATMLFVATNAHAQASLHVACFSVQRAFSESVDGKAALARLTTIQNEKARAIDEKNKALRAQEQTLEQSSSLLSETARAERTNEVAKLRIDVQRFVEDAQADLLGIQRDAENAFVVKLKPALAKVAQDKGLQLVFNVDEGAVAWFDPSLDITGDVVKQLALK
ncbi:MAG TPA: OmpH family outer membrane protein [Vicinamibacterales bacterium]|nr:OmpH family outer membrane protein [Vicinamibacterales bacterium]